MKHEQLKNYIELNKMKGKHIKINGTRVNTIKRDTYGAKYLHESM